MTSASSADADLVDASSPRGSAPAIHISGLVRDFDDRRALDGVSFTVARGEVMALLGPNGAGKTTLLRILTGLAAPGAGTVEILGQPIVDFKQHRVRRAIGLVPSGDRTFYLRLNGYENLLFFARMHGMRRSVARARALACLSAVDLDDAAKQPVGTYSHGMQKRLSVARALLAKPTILLVDEATHDLDPENALRVRNLVAAAAADGSAVIWATQRLDEIRGFAHSVALLHRGRVQFDGTVPELQALADSRRYLFELRTGAPSDRLATTAAGALRGLAVIDPGREVDGGHVVVALAPATTLSDAVMALHSAGLEVLACREERSELEVAFLHLTREAS